MKPRRATIAAMVLCGFLPGGCHLWQCPQTAPAPLEQVLDAYNANAHKVPRLWARARISVKLGGSLSWGGINGVLLMEKPPPADRFGPHSFVLVGKEIGGVELFRVGCSREEGVYYFWWNLGKRGRAWVGQNAFAGAPGIEALPIDPMQLLAVLSVCDLPSDLTDAPMVGMTMDARPWHCAYVLTYIDRQPITRRLGFRREMYFPWRDDGPHPPGRPSTIKFLDAAGRRIMTATLKDYKPIAPGEEGGGESDPPVMPTDIRIEWPQQKSHIQLRLSEMTREKKGNPTKAVSLLRYLPESIPVKQIDRHIRPPRSRK